MFNTLLSNMAIQIYNNVYGSGQLLKTIQNYDKVLDSVTKVFNSESAISLSMTSLSVGITALLFFVDLSGKVTEKNFSIEQFFKSLLRFVTTYMFIMNAGYIIEQIMDIGTSAIPQDVEYGIDFFTKANKAMFINGLAEMKLGDLLSYILQGIIPWILSLISEVMIQVIIISRILEISVMSVFAPLAIADIYREGTQSNGVTYMKKMLALALQVTVIVMINIATQSIVSAIVGIETGKDFYMLLEIKEHAEGEPAMFTEESLSLFLEALLGGNSRNAILKSMGIMFARVGMIWNSMSLCEEITGAK